MKIRVLKCHFHYIILRVHTIDMIITIDYDIDYLAEVVFFNENYFFPLLYTVLFGKMSQHAFHT